jgi:hypothetical protein
MGENRSSAFDRAVPARQYQRPDRRADRAPRRLEHEPGVVDAEIGALPDGPQRRPLAEAYQCHLAASVPKVRGDQMSEHQLATFVLLALTGTDRTGPRPSRF